MFLRDLLCLVRDEKRKKDIVKVAQKLAIGMGVVATVGVITGIFIASKLGSKTREEFKKKASNNVGTMKDTVRNKAEMVKDSATHAAQEVCDVIKDVNEKVKGVKNDIKGGCHEITQDIYKTAESISQEL